MICGAFAGQAPASSHANPGDRRWDKLPASRLPVLILTKDQIVRSYDIKGLIMTAQEFAIKPSTLASRLKQWGVALHGRGWRPLKDGAPVRHAPVPTGEFHRSAEAQPAEVSGRSAAQQHGASAARPKILHDAATMRSLAEYLGRIESVVKASAQATETTPAFKHYQAGRLEMVQALRALVEQLRTVG